MLLFHSIFASNHATFLLVLWKIKECLGIKTGITSTAGPCLSSYFKLKDKKIVIVVFKAEGKEDRFKES